MTKKIIWRLKEVPSSENLRQLVKDGILTKDEARTVLFSEQEDAERDVKSLESEIKFLRELVEKLSKDRNTIVETIRYIENPYLQYRWYTPYSVWCGNAGGINTTTTNNSLAMQLCSNSQIGGSCNDLAFSNISTF